jgi:hypothetical protein
VGESPETLAIAARVAPTAAEALAATVRWAALAPASSRPLTVALEQSLSRGVDEYLETGLVALLDGDRLTPDVEPLLTSVLGKLGGTARLERAAELAVRAATLLGATGGTLAPLALELARRAGVKRAIDTALELELAGVARTDRATQLRVISEHHRKAGDTASEMRALLRLLAAAPRDPSAVDRLAAIHAEAGNYDHMLATLALRTDEGATPVERAIGLLSLAKANIEVRDDRARAEEFLAAAMEPPDGDESEAQRIERVLTVALGMVSMGMIDRAIDLLERDAVADRPGAHKLIERAIEIALREKRDRERALKLLEAELARRGTFRGRLLLMFEQLSLEKRDVGLAERTYAALVDGAMGESGRRALRYRRARWLEKAGAGREALRAYVEACEHASSTGAIASAVERLARELGDLEALAGAWMALSRAAPHPVLAERLVRRASRVFLEETARPERAFDVLFESWKSSFSAELEDDLARAATATEEVDPKRGAEAFQGIFDVLRARADDAWTGEEKARLLRKLARVHRARGDLASAESVAREAIAAQRADDPDEMALAGALTELAAWIERARPADARVLIDEALKLDATNADAQALDARLPRAAPQAAAPAPAATVAPISPPSAPPPAPSEAPPSEPEAAASDDEPAPIPLTRRTTPPPMPAVRFAPAGPDESEGEVLARPSLIDMYRPASSPPARGPIALPDVEPARSEVDLVLERAAAASRALESEAACALLRSALVMDPTRADVAERLAREAEASGRDAERLLALGALSNGTRPIAALEVSPQAARGALAAHLAHPAHARVLTVLARVYESCQPLFRMQLAQLGVVGTDRVGARGASPVARALLATIDLFGWDEPQLFVSRRPFTTSIVRSQPPALVIGLDIPRDERELRFVIARGLSLTRPENVLVASLSAAEGTTLLAAIRAAFGPADGTRVSRDAAALASELWRMLSPAKQRDVRELLQGAWETLDYPAVRASVLGGAARAGLMVAGDVGAALRGLALVEEPPMAISEGQPSLTLARSSGAAADLLRFAFGDALLDSVRVARA